MRIFYINISDIDYNNINVLPILMKYFMKENERVLDIYMLNNNFCSVTLSLAVIIIMIYGITKIISNIQTVSMLKSFIICCFE